MEGKRSWEARRGEMGCKERWNVSEARGGGRQGDLGGEWM